ncbi:Glutamyl-tRNA(Gln) amidotransferase subunit A [Marinibacterium anthonyi]|nr:Glutamyl-tRNA(Gln) amidotransferase subunit A [Marinibacterium anthonyi]
MPTDTPLPFRSATALADGLRTGKLTAAQLMEATLARIDAVNGQVNAIVSMADPGALMDQARAADKAGLKGALAGLPIAIKDLANARGFETSMGSPLFKGTVAPKDDIMVARLRAAGAIVIGKTNTPEFGLGSHTFNPVHGATLNPYDLTRSCGGSSGGAAVALATGMLAIADGSDMMGSLRNPAAWNNVYGYRPSWGRVPSEAIGDNFLHQMSTLGPMGRSPQDVALLLDVMSGPDPRQPHGCPVSPVSPLTPGDLTGKRIGWLGDWGGALAFEPGILDLCRGALAQMEEAGAIVDDLAPPFPMQRIWDSWITLRSWSVATGMAVLDRAHLKDSAIWELDRGLAMSAMEIHRASVIRSEWFTKAARLFDEYDALVLPSAQVWPFPVEKPWKDEINGQKLDTYHRWMEVVVPAGLLGLPVLAAPAGFGDNGLPMGFQIIGRRGADADILSLGAAWHAMTDWPGRRPALM